MIEVGIATTRGMIFLDNFKIINVIYNKHHVHRYTKRSADVPEDIDLLKPNR